MMEVRTDGVFEVEIQWDGTEAPHAEDLRKLEGAEAHEVLIAMAAADVQDRLAEVALLHGVSEAEILERIRSR